MTFRMDGFNREPVGKTAAGRIEFFAIDKIAAISNRERSRQGFGIFSMAFRATIGQAFTL